MTNKECKETLKRIQNNLERQTKTLNELKKIEERKEKILRRMESRLEDLE